MEKDVPLENQEVGLSVQSGAYLPDGKEVADNTPPVSYIYDAQGGGDEISKD